MNITALPTVVIALLTVALSIFTVRRTSSRGLRRLARPVMVWRQCSFLLTRVPALERCGREMARRFYPVAVHFGGVHDFAPFIPEQVGPETVQAAGSALTL